MSQLSIQDINAAIIGGTFTDSQLSSIIDAVRYARAIKWFKTSRKKGCSQKQQNQRKTIRDFLKPEKRSKV